MNEVQEAVLVLCDMETEYAQLMTEFMNKRDDLPWSIRTYTDPELLMQSEQKVDILLVAESSYREEMKELSTGRMVILNESGIVRDEAMIHVNKYQSADNVIRELLAIYLEIVQKVFPRIRAGGSTIFIGFYSPVRRCLQTPFALTMSQILARNKRTLYLNFEYFIGDPELQADQQTRDLADLLYFLGAEQDKFAVRLQSMVKQIGSLDYVPPMKVGQNLLSITIDEWMTFFRQLQNLGTYEYVILDLSESMQGLFEILRICERIYTIVTQDRFGSYKLSQYEQLLEMCSCEDVLEKTRKCSLPKIKQLPVAIQYYTRGELADYVWQQIFELTGENKYHGNEEREN